MVIIKKLPILMIILILFSNSFSYADGYKVNHANNLLIRENLNLIKTFMSLKTRPEEEKAEDIPVLLYHHIATKEEIESYGWENNGSIVSLEEFTEQMTYLKENGYYAASLSELDLFLDKKIDLPKKTAVITFDDGYLSNAVYAYPIMKEYGFKGSIFMVGETTTRDETNLGPGALLHIAATEIHKYEDVFEFGCHTYGLHNKNDEGIALLQALPKDEIIKNLSKNMELFNTKYIAYPYGQYGLDTIEYLKELGYKMAFTVDHGYVSKDTNKYELPRVVIFPKTSISEFETLVNLE